MTLTAWHALVERGRVQPGQRVPIPAGAAGLGSIASQSAKHLGATVATTAGSSNRGSVHEFGGDTVIDYRAKTFKHHLDGYDLVPDSRGGEKLERCLWALKPGGRPSTSPVPHPPRAPAGPA